MIELKYKSPYEPKIVYASDKNFNVRLKAIVSNLMQACGYDTTSTNFKRFIAGLDKAEDYLFAGKKTVKKYPTEREIDYKIMDVMGKCEVSPDVIKMRKYILNLIR